MFSYSSSLSQIPSIGKSLAKKLTSLGINTIGDLLYHFPFRYDDFTEFRQINELEVGQTVTVQGQIVKISTTKTWKKKMALTEAHVTDGQGQIKAVWFNAPAPVRFLSKGKYVQLSGKIASGGKNQEPYFSHPNVEIISQSSIGNQNIEASPRSTSTGNLAPVYPETKGINSYFLRRLIKTYLGRTVIHDFIPRDILETEQLIDLKTALHNIHFPENQADLALAKQRFAFEKMFLIQLKALQVKKNWETKSAVPVAFDEPFIKQFVKSLPFALTTAQKKSAWQIIRDLEQTKPMNRLLEGDVGSGKTVVAAMAAISVAHQKYQVAILAPTEVLAIQHFHGLSRFFKNSGLAIGLLTGSKTELNCNINAEDETATTKPKLSKKKFLENLETGQIDIAIGTHALLQQKVRFKNLALVIIDEQHRFGVNQRAHLQQGTLNLDDGMNKTIPHLLSMTATPIPRTLSLALFGNLNLSIIDEYPQGRKKIITKVIPPKEREIIYDFIRQQIQAGRQAFVICPLVEETSKMSEVKAVTEEHKRLQEEIFPEFKLGLLHGKMPSKSRSASGGAFSKEEIMQKFKNREYDILVSTSVVEVGVDVPNATIMLIEGAERFGLSQLHQFRGRVGRGEHQSYCYLFTSENIGFTTRRLKSMEKTNDGFKIAEYDLNLRGPGQFLGTLQSGVPDIAMESLTDVKLIQASRLEAQRILAFDPQLENFPLLKQQIDQLANMIHWE